MLCLIGKYITLVQNTKIIHISMSAPVAETRRHKSNSGAAKSCCRWTIYQKYLPVLVKDTHAHTYTHTQTRKRRNHISWRKISNKNMEILTHRRYARVKTGYFRAWVQSYSQNLALHFAAEKIIERSAHRLSCVLSACVSLSPFFSDRKCIFYIPVAASFNIIKYFQNGETTPSCNKH